MPHDPTDNDFRYLHADGPYEINRSLRQPPTPKLEIRELRTRVDELSRQAFTIAAENPPPLHGLTEY